MREPIDLAAARPGLGDRIDLDAARRAYEELKAADEQDLRLAAVLAMGILLGGSYPGSHAAVVLLYQRAWPDMLPTGVMAMLGIEAP